MNGNNFQNWLNDSLQKEQEMVFQPLLSFHRTSKVFIKPPVLLWLIFTTIFFWTLKDISRNNRHHSRSNCRCRCPPKSPFCNSASSPWSKSYSDVPFSYPSFPHGFSSLSSSGAFLCVSHLSHSENLVPHLCQQLFRVEGLHCNRKRAGFRLSNFERQKAKRSASHVWNLQQWHWRKNFDCFISSSSQVQKPWTLLNAFFSTPFNFRLRCIIQKPPCLTNGKEKCRNPPRRPRHKPPKSQGDRPFKDNQHNIWVSKLEYW